jgi:hypothetical protein
MLAALDGLRMATARVDVKHLLNRPDRCRDALSFVSHDKRRFRCSNSSTLALLS